MSKNKKRGGAESGSRRLSGTGIAPGIAFGIAYRIEPQYPAFYRIRIPRKDVEAELERFHRALDKSREQYLQDKKKFEEAVGREHSYIIDAHLMMLEDKHLLGEIERLVREKLDSPEKALIQVSDQLLSAYNSLKDPFFRERAYDFEEVIERIVSNLMELRPADDLDPREDLILVAPEVGLSVIARYPLERIRGLVLTKAGRTSHVAIIARSFQIPVVSGIEGIREQIKTGDTLVVDGSNGFVDVVENLGTIKESVVGTERKAPAQITDRNPCVTRDGERVFLYANTEFGREVSLALDLGAEGIGLFRSEYIYMRQRAETLDEQQHHDIYRKLAEKVGNYPAVVRTLDIAVRQHAETQAGEEGAALGVRGIRLSLKNPEMFKTQIRAILKARAYGNLRIVLPMISSVDELSEGRRLIREVESDLLEAGSIENPIQVGSLIEVPAAILTLDAIAANSDFLAVGTNDLIQYTLAAGRLNEEIAYLYNPVHPAVLASLSHVVQVARRNNQCVMVCGEMAAHPVYSSILVGLGFRHLSMTAIAIPEIKRSIRAGSCRELTDKAKGLLGLSSLIEIKRYVEEEFGLERWAKDEFILQS